MNNTGVKAQVAANQSHVILLAGIYFQRTAEPGNNFIYFQKGGGFF